MLEQLQNIFRNTFKIDDLIINESTTANDIYQWDSLTHIALITNVEEHFKVKFSFNNIIGFNTVGDMIAVLKTKNLL